MKREKELALGHENGSGKQAAGIEAVWLAHMPQQHGSGHQVQCHHGIFKVDLEGVRPFARHEDGRQNMRIKQQQPKQGRHQSKHQPQHGQQVPERAVAAFVPVHQGDGKQGQCAQQPCRQPKMDGFLRRTGGDEVRHTGVRQHVAKVEQPNAQEGVGQQQGVARQVLVPCTPDDAKNQPCDDDGQGFQCHVQRQIACDTLHACVRGQPANQQQNGQRHADGADSVAGFRLVAGVNRHGRQ